MIRFISSLAYASVAKLGYDPNMQLLWTNKRWNYRITITGKDDHGSIATKVYETVDIIADTSYNQRGRATRVYEAYDVENPGTAVVIKDSWVDADRPKEADTLSEILDDASDDEKTMFMTVLLHGVVIIDGREDLTRDLLMDGYLVSTSGNSIMKTKEPRKLADALAEMMLDLDISDRGAKGTVQGDHRNVYEASVFELSSSKPNLLSTTPVTSPDVSLPSFNQTQLPPRVYGARAHYRIV